MTDPVDIEILRDRIQRHNRALREARREVLSDVIAMFHREPQRRLSGNTAARLVEQMMSEEEESK